jgi:hypothetical protein
MPEPRNAMLIKIFFGNQMDSSQFATHLRELRQHHAHLLERYEKEIPSVIKQYANVTHAFKDAPYWAFTLDYGKRIDRMVFEWCDEVLRQIGDEGKKKSHRKKTTSPSKKLGKSLRGRV